METLINFIHWPECPLWRSARNVLTIALAFTAISCRSDEEHIVHFDDGDQQVVLSNLYPAIGETVTASFATGSKVVGTINFGDGSGEQSIQEGVNHVYEEAGNYVVTTSLHVADSVKVGRQNVKVAQLALTRLMTRFSDPNYKDVLVMAHRANTGNMAIPENSISAVKAAIAAGCDFIECDPRLTKDGQVVVCHDENISRTTTGSGNISNLTLSQLQSYMLKDRMGRPTNEVMPTLKQFLEAARGHVYVNLDYPTHTATSQIVFDIVKECGMLEQVLFYVNTADKAREILQLCPTAHVYAWGTPDVYAPLKNIGRNSFVQFTLGSDNAAIVSARNDNMIVTDVVMDDTNGKTAEADLINGNSKTFDDLLGLGIRMFMTDSPYQVLGYLRAKGLHQ